jgi:hypothetical protein
MLGINRVVALVAVHSVATSAGGGGVRWYEFTVDSGPTVRLAQQGTCAPDGFYRWMASPAIDRAGNIGIGYSFGGTPARSRARGGPGPADQHAPWVDAHRGVPAAGLLLKGALPP